jgi:hypothetical protein
MGGEQQTLRCLQVFNPSLQSFADVISPFFLVCEVWIMTDEKLKRVRSAIDLAMSDVVGEFLRNPFQFHGDTGISHFLYHRIHCRAGEFLYSLDEGPVPKTLLLQSEDYTESKYRGSGKSDSPGRLDFSYVDEDTLKKEQVVANHAFAQIAIEVGLDKGPDAAVGQVAADKTERGIQPADAAKIIRELRFAGLKFGYVLECYRPDEVEAALSVSQRITRDLQTASEFAGSDRFTFIMVLAGDDEQSPAVSTWPSSWKEAHLADRNYQDISSISIRPEVGGHLGFLADCGPCNRLLQAALLQLVNEHAAGQRPCYRRKNMSLARGYRIKVSNRNDRPERIYDMASAVKAALVDQGFQVQGNQLEIPIEENHTWVARVISAVRQVMDSLLPVCLHPTDETPTSSVESLEPIVRDTMVSAGVKQLHDFVCQVCGTRLVTSDGPYAEAAHIQPLGSPHDGPDIPENVLCLCPNHHVLFDGLAFAVADDLSLVGLEGQLRTAAGHTIGLEFLRHHRRRFEEARKPAR